MANAAQRDAGTQSQGYIPEVAPLPPMFGQDSIAFDPNLLQAMFGGGGPGGFQEPNDDLAFLLGGLTGNLPTSGSGGETAQAIFGLPLDFGGMNLMVPPSDANPAHGLAPGIGNPGQGLPPGIGNQMMENNDAYGHQQFPLMPEFTQHENGLSPEEVNPGAFGFAPPHCSLGLYSSTGLWAGTNVWWDDPCPWNQSWNEHERKWDVPRRGFQQPTFSIRSARRLWKPRSYAIRV